MFLGSGRDTLRWFFARLSRCWKCQGGDGSGLRVLEAGVGSVQGVFTRE